MKVQKVCGYGIVFDDESCLRWQSACPAEYKGRDIKYILGNECLETDFKKPLKFELRDDMCVWFGNKPDKMFKLPVELYANIGGEINYEMFYEGKRIRCRHKEKKRIDTRKRPLTKEDIIRSMTYSIDNSMMNYNMKGDKKNDYRRN